MSVERSRMIEEELVQYIAENLVNDPEQINLSRRDSGRTVVLKLSVAKNDMGRMIGRSGRVANSIRALLRALPSQEEGRDRRRRRVILEIE
ncbi:MAG: KH domain-containing protein [Chloroflexota bacterium]|nr:KH domain-containing protein [Chloroflexota bacterium]MDE2857851.1 KH domain-containing protein [Chloroflexota bacterium]